MDKKLKQAEEEFPFFKKVWLISELARTNNHLEIKNKYKRIFKKPLSDVILADTSTAYMNDIVELKKISRLDIENHELSDPYKRMEHFENVRKMCMEGYQVGVDAMGMPAMKQDPKGAIEAVKQAREEGNMIVQNELKLLQLYIQGEKLKQIQSGIPPSQITTTVIPPDVEIVDSKPQTDTDQFFTD